MVDCKDCQWFRSFPGDTVWKRRTGCYQPQHMDQKLAERVHQAQEIPGDHEKLNVRRDCGRFEALPRKGSLISRMLSALRS
ncbi:MAG: hypothetical protein FJ298_06295 [Planctomycetes bacterium]|nr:hypothetical protein [Planctomycetota bacterium]